MYSSSTPLFAWQAGGKDESEVVLRIKLFHTHRLLQWFYSTAEAN